MKKFLIAIGIVPSVSPVSWRSSRSRVARATRRRPARRTSGRALQLGLYMGMLRARRRSRRSSRSSRRRPHDADQRADVHALELPRQHQLPNTGQRVQYTCRLPNGQEVKNVEVVSGTFAWDEDIAGAELVPGKGKATRSRPRCASGSFASGRVRRAPEAANAGGDETTVAEAAGR